jgi:FkbM family methyltransferase
MSPDAIAGGIALAELVCAALVYARRAGLHAGALERQLIALREQIAAYREEDHKRAQEAADRQEYRLKEAVRAEGIAPIQAELREVASRMRGQVESLAADVQSLSERETALSAQMGRTSARVEKIADAVEIVTRRPLQGFPIDAARLETRTEAEVLKLAESVAILRPLAPYPRWRFDADWWNPDLTFQLRRRIWQYFNERRLEGRVTVRWHAGTSLCLYLGNDLSRQIFIGGCFDPNEFAFLDRYLQPGMTLIDAGANEGVYTIFAARKVGAEGTVWAFEPSRRERDRLQRNLELNRLAAKVFPQALAEKTSQAELSVAGYEHEGQNTLGGFSFDTTELARKEVVEAATLDEVVASENPPRINVMKIDIEGAELRMLQGAYETLRHYRPILMFEVMDEALQRQGSSREALLDYLREQQYQPYMFDPYSGLPAEAPPGVYGENMLAVPNGWTLPDAVYNPWPSECGPPS